MDPSAEQLDAALLALVAKHAAAENKWAAVAQELGRSKQWCKHRAAKLQEAAPAWREQPLEGKGLGVVATRAIAYLGQLR